MSSPFQTPPARLSDADIEQLGNLLEAVAVPNEGMSLEMLDGFLSALIVGPRVVEPEEYLPLIWNHEPAWPSEATGKQAQRLIQALWNDIIERLQIELDEDDEEDDQAQMARVEAAMPLLAFPEPPEDADEDDPFAAVPEDFPLGAAWAVGFMRGTSLRQDAWSRWEQEDDGVADDLEMIASLALLDAEHAAEMDLDADAVPGFSERLGIVSQIPEMLRAFNARRTEELRPQPAQRGDAPGRNDPCPCGSGQKYKKCCGDPAKLN